MKEGTAWHYLCTCPVLQNMHSIEREERASNSEKKRWLQNKSVLINGVKPGPDDEIDEVTQLVFFPKNEKRRITML